MKTSVILLLSLSIFAIPAAASAETAVVEAVVTKAGKRTPIASLTLDVAADGSTTELEAAGSAGNYRVAVSRDTGKRGPAPLRFRVDINRGRDGHFKLRSARAIKPASRTVIGSFRQAGGELLEVAVTTRP